ncbi:hypothetical protein HOD08_03920 [bacterium]|jgi:hypothetical protein|nr:hypothetical protein [bacterium]
MKFVFLIIALMFCVNAFAGDSGAGDSENPFLKKGVERPIIDTSVVSREKQPFALIGSTHNGKIYWVPSEEADVAKEFFYTCLPELRGRRMCEMGRRVSEIVVRELENNERNERVLCGAIVFLCVCIILREFIIAEKFDELESAWSNLKFKGLRENKLLQNYLFNACNWIIPKIGALDFSEEAEKFLKENDSFEFRDAIRSNHAAWISSVLRSALEGKLVAGSESVADAIADANELLESLDEPCKSSDSGPCLKALLQYCNMWFFAENITSVDL